MTSHESPGTPDTPGADPGPVDAAAPPAPESPIPSDQQRSEFPQYDLTPPAAPKKRRAMVATAAAVATAIVVGIVVSTTLSSGNSSSNTAAASASTSASAAAAQSAVIASIVAQAVATSPSAPATNPVAIPASADGLAQQTDSTGQNVVAAMKKSDAGSSAAAFYSGALFAAYSKSGSDAIYADLTLVPMADSTDLEALYASQGASGALTTMGGASSFKDVQTIAAPMPNSAMDCGLVSADGLTLNSCTWIDASEFGIFVSTESISAAQAASYSEAFEATSEGVSQ